MNIPTKTNVTTHLILPDVNVITTVAIPPKTSTIKIYTENKYDIDDFISKDPPFYIQALEQFLCTSVLLRMLQSSLLNDQYARLQCVYHQRNRNPTQLLIVFPWIKPFPYSLQDIVIIQIPF